ncbi:endolytic transglycosylase MltG [Patescibacteria group bacterium]|nr:MAG: endolytic transglycosylase MltG [Patescibacteria group bacterium]
MGLCSWVWMSYQTALTEPVVKTKTLIKIEKGDSINKLIDKLQEQQIPIDSMWFKFMAYQQNASNKLKVGEYELKSGSTALQILALFVSGKTHQYSVTFPEGWNFKQILQKLNANPDLKHTLEGMDNQAIMAKLNADKKHPEGLFFPDTYFFAKNATDFSVLKKAYDKMQSVLAEEWQHREPNLPLQNPYQALILASIVEKETAAPAERPLIAGVFVQRLKMGMLLQTDPTVIYGMGDSYQGNIRSQDLRTATPYNTYVIKGLPPTPIAMPGKEAIRATLHPGKTNNLYFVARGSHGAHVFSATLKAHNEAVNQFQRHIKP